MAKGKKRGLIEQKSINNGLKLKKIKYSILSILCIAQRQILKETAKSYRLLPLRSRRGDTGGVLLFCKKP